MPNCSVFSCKKRSETSSLKKDNVTFHLFPKDGFIRDVWFRACANHVSWSPKRTSTICSEHFETSCFIIQSNNKRRLKPCAVPTLKLSEIDPLEDSELETSTSKSKNVGTLEDRQPPQTQECNFSKDQPHTSQSENNIFNSPFYILEDRRMKIKLKRLLLMKNKQIKRLHSQIRYLRKKVAGQQIIINDLKEKSD